MAAGIDLHIHSNASDGTLSPIEILTRARELNLTAISITDHDTIAAYTLLEDIDPSEFPELITGVEISSAWPSGLEAGGSLHMLGYDFDCRNSQLKALLSFLNQSRLNRTPQMVARLQALNIPIQMKDLEEGEPGTCSLGRPHIAKWLVAKGYAKSIDAAFDDFLGAGGPAYVDKERIACAEAIHAINQAGGIAVLAHPGILPTPQGGQFEALLKTLLDLGLRGIEIYYPDHTPAQVNYYQTLALKMGLLVTGGTDFHGDLIPGLEMGSGRGGFDVPQALMAPLHERRRQLTPSLKGYHGPS